ncbi:hypothetical protein QMK19_33975 [Streptomyces sp. H10-C2]|uniref:hypothetical protein n=1 Tax=unclassified Streptomyces TaxID=2593676 RepID=UPI0024B9E1E1|nr:MULTISPECIES: hypothetical protein [unclassified Streptomyces]MDJ0345557.1 hypothetical protein [Streptomyces sp. PH10-H1]MDJ0374503.1 hypothetical protein [Streptomyces sp. H10-C2]
MDLGEGTPRRALVLGLILYAVWSGALLLLFGLPNRFSFTAYFLPPLVIVIYGTQPSRKVDRRWNIAYWAIGIRYAVLGHRPIICGGRRAATRSEWISRRARWGTRADALIEAPGGGALERWLGTEDTNPVGAGAPLRLAARPRLYGPDAVVRARGRRSRKHMEAQA